MKNRNSYEIKTTPSGWIAYMETKGMPSRLMATAHLDESGFVLVHRDNHAVQRFGALAKLLCAQYRLIGDRS